jgi:membrane-associated phospholipid phosphatase
MEGIGAPPNRRGWWRRGIAGETPAAAALTAVLLVAWYAMSLVYPVLNHGPSRINLRTPLDDALPIVPAFVVPYVSLTSFVGLSMAIFLAIRVRILRSAAVAMMLAWAVSYACYFLMQSYIERPTLTGADLFSQMVRAVYAGDNPYNDFPSLHVSLSTIIAIHWWRVDRRVGLVVGAWTALIVCSTVLIRQHHLADVAGGLVLAAAASWLSWRWVGA